MQLHDFQIGERIRLADTVTHEEYRGAIGTIRTLIKSRNVVEVDTVNALGHKALYDADPSNVEHLEPFIVPTFGLSDPTRHEFCFATEQRQPCKCERSCARCGNSALVTTMELTTTRNLVCPPCTKRPEATASNPIG